MKTDNAIRYVFPIAWILAILSGLLGAVMSPFSPVLAILVVILAFGGAIYFVKGKDSVVIMVSAITLTLIGGFGLFADLGFAMFDEWLNILLFTALVMIASPVAIVEALQVFIDKFWKV